MIARRALLATGLLASPAGLSRAQAPKDRPARIGLLRASPTPDRSLAALRQGLAAMGYAEGQGFVFVPGFGDGDTRRLPQLAAAMVAAGIDIIITEGLVTALAARSATTTIPIVMASSPDPQRGGLIDSLSRPGGNVTGLSSQADEASGKLLEFIKELVPGLSRVVIFAGRVAWDSFGAETSASARQLGLEIVRADLDIPDFDALLRQAVTDRAQAGVVRGRPFLADAQARSIVERAAAHRLPIVYESRDFAEFGGLMAFGVDLPAQYRRVAWYVDQILRGAKAAELPVEQPIKFELLINLRAAKALGITVPAVLLARADEVLE